MAAGTWDSQVSPAAGISSWESQVGTPFRPENEGRVGTLFRPGNRVPTDFGTKRSSQEGGRVHQG